MFATKKARLGVSGGRVTGYQCSSGGIEAADEQPCKRFAIVGVVMKRKQ